MLKLLFSNLRGSTCYSKHRFAAASTVATTNKPSHRNKHEQNQEYLEPHPFIGSWEPPKNPKEALKKLASLRRDYGKQVKELRKQYIYEIELQRQEQLRKDEARKLQILQAKEERMKLKAAAAEARAVERKQFEEEFKQTLMKEREEKLNYWRTRDKAIKEKKSSEKEQIHRQSSLWIDEKELEQKILRAITDTIPL